MTAESAFREPARGDPPAIRTTLLDLVRLLSGLTDSEEQTLRMARALLATRKVQLTGSFKDCRQELLT
jgi:hypothetical protein